MKRILSFILAAMLCLPMSAIKVHTIGDSTMEERNPAVTDIRGWAQYLASFFNTDQVTVNNRGKSGADSRNFYTGAAYWPSVKAQMSAGDYLIIQFAHNDEGTITHGTDNWEYLAYCKTINPDTVLSDARGTNPQTTFRDYMRAYIDEARALGVTPILMAPICRAYFNGNTIKRNGQHDLGDNFWKIEDGKLLMNQSLPANDSSMSYVHAMREVAKEKNVVFLDLMEETKKIYLSYESGEACLNAMFTWKDDAHTQHDATHTSALGASQIARAAAQLMKNAGVLADYITIPTDITVSPNAIEIGETYCGVPQDKEFLLTGYGLEPAAGKVALKATANLQLSLDKETYASTANAVYSGGSMFQKVYVRALYSEGGEQKDTVFVTAGEKVIALPFIANAISLVGGVDVSATWALNAKPAPAPVIVGPITASMDRSHIAHIDYNSSKNYFEDGDEKNIILARFHNSEDGSKRTPWPAGELDENADRYIDFSITAPATMDIRVSGISMEVAADGTTAMNYHVNTGFGDGFTDNTTIANKQHIANRKIEHVNLTTTINLPAGETLHVRILPWHDSNEEKDSKYIALRNVKIEGKAFEAGGTGVEEVGRETANAMRSEKILRNGQLLILKEGKTYNVLGVQL